MSFDDIEYLDNHADIKIRQLFDKELARSRELTRLLNFSDMIECVRIGISGTQKSTFRAYKDGKKEIESRIAKLKGIKKRNITGLFKPGMKF